MYPARPQAAPLRGAAPGFPLWLEPTLGGLLALVAVAGHVSLRSESLALGLDLLAALGCGLAGRRWRVATVIVGATLAAYVVVPQFATIGQAAALVLVLSLSARGRTLPGVASACGAAALTCAADLPRAGGGWPWQSLVFWFSTLSSALLVGLGIRTFALMQDAVRQSHLEAERARIARDLHDTVAHRLTTLSLWAQRAQQEGAPLEQGWEYLVGATQASVRDLRAVLSLLSTDPADPRSSGADLLADTLRREAARLRSEGFVVEVEAETLTPSGARPAAVLSECLVEVVNNVSRHGAPGSTCRILVVAGHDDLECLVVNEVAKDVARRGTGQPGRGLSGLVARAAEVGGTVMAAGEGPLWLTRVTIPVGARSASLRLAHG